MSISYRYNVETVHEKELKGMTMTNQTALLVMDMQGIAE